MGVEFLDVCQKGLTRLGSNHFSILLDCGGLSGGRQYFSKEITKTREDYREDIVISLSQREYLSVSLSSPLIAGNNL